MLILILLIHSSFTAAVHCRQFLASTIGSRMLKSTSASSTPVVDCSFWPQNCRHLIVHWRSVMSAYLLKPVLNGSSACSLASKLICQVWISLIVLLRNISAFMPLLPLGAGGIEVFVSSVHAFMCLTVHPRSLLMSYFVNRLGKFYQICCFAALWDKYHNMNRLHFEPKRSKVKVKCGQKGGGIS